MQIRTQVYCFVLFLAVLLTSSLVQSQVGSQNEPGETASAPAPARAGADGPFLAAVSEHFDVSRGQVQELIEGGLEPSQVVVACFIAQRALRQPGEIAVQRHDGRSWREIAVANGLGPEQFYTPLPFGDRKPFVNVHALFHDQPRSQWSWESVPLEDRDVENLVNLRFVSELSGEQAPEVLRLRSQGLDFPSIHQLLDGQRTAQAEGRDAAALRS
jgi:hypothetical protein